MKISVEMDIKQVSRYIANVHKKQIPFAASQALNDTAWDARRELQDQLPKKLQSPKKFTVDGVRVGKSSKRRLMATVYFADNRAKYMHHQVHGGIRAKGGSGVVAVPTRNVKLNGQGNPVKSQRPAELMKRSDVFSGVPRGHNLPAGIYMRGHISKRGKFSAATKSRATNIHAMYIYKKSTSYTSAVPMKKIASGVVRSKFKNNFDRRLAAAIRSAR